jgi:hypothetical protein
MKTGGYSMASLMTKGLELTKEGYRFMSKVRGSLQGS